ncbi:LIM domain-binding protein 2a [Pungitius pungitius]|uniref:LIM domain-binding protein 2a n=1 Tax=Pungitius pungitius TaxID=134920 RepID=UPI002E0DCC5E
MSNPTHDPFYSSPFGPFYRRHAPYMVQPEYRIYEMNKRLQTRTEESDSLWWDAFATEFFEEDATLTLSFCLEDGPKRYTIGRTLIPRYFSTVFEGGVSELHYILKHSKESFHNSCITLDCDQCTMVTQHGKPMFTKVTPDPRAPPEKENIKSCTTRRRINEQNRTNTVNASSGQKLQQNLKNSIMLAHRKAFSNLTFLLFFPAFSHLLSTSSSLSFKVRSYNGKWEKRKGPETLSTCLRPLQDVMVVGEPTLMGGEFGDEDERLITRLENTQYDATNGLDDEDDFNGSPALGNSAPWSSKPPGGQDSKAESTAPQPSQ